MEQVNPGSTEVAAERHTVSMVIPVYQGERTLAGLVDEILPLTLGFTTPQGRDGVVTEVLLVYDNGPDDSARVMRELAAQFDFVRTVWLSRNFGQHPATLAGMASSGGDWIVTLDEDGQHDPAEIVRMLDVALTERAALVYAQPTNPAPHGFLRNLASRSAKRLLAISAGGQNATEFQSFRLILGEIGRSVAAYSGSGVYLDVAMSWVAGKVATCPIELRDEGDRPSGYSLRTLSSHFWRMVISSGTQALRIVSILGVLSAIGGFVLAVILLIARLTGSQDIPQGWPSLMVVILLTSGAILFSLGVIAEYIGVAVNMAMGKPLYLIVSDPDDGPLGRSRLARPTSGPARPATRSGPPPPAGAAPALPSSSAEPKSAEPKSALPAKPARR